MPYRGAVMDKINTEVLRGCCEEDPNGGLEVVLDSRVYRILFNDLRKVVGITIESGCKGSKVIFLRLPIVKDDHESIYDGLEVICKLLKNKLRVEERGL